MYEATLMRRKKNLGKYNGETTATLMAARYLERIPMHKKRLSNYNVHFIKFKRT